MNIVDHIYANCGSWTPCYITIMIPPYLYCPPPPTLPTPTWPTDPLPSPLCTPPHPTFTPHPYPGYPNSTQYQCSSIPSHTHTTTAQLDSIESHYLSLDYSQILELPNSGWHHPERVEAITTEFLYSHHWWGFTLTNVPIKLSLC